MIPAVLAANMDARDRRWALGCTLAFLVAGLLHVALVIPGLPYDEPAHFNVVQFYSKIQGLPIVGTSSVQYEAYHPPFYYVLFGLVYRLASVGGVKVAFYAVRLATLGATTPLVYLTYQAAREFSGHRGVAQLAAVLVGLNPSIVAISSSIQNDSLLFLLTTLAAYLCIRWTMTHTLSMGRAGLLGVVTAAAMLTKIQAIILVPFVVVMILAKYRSRSTVRLVVFLVIIAACTSWWFIRNIHLYGDWTGSHSVAELFGRGGRFEYWKLSSWHLAAQSLITYLTIPVTYWRHMMKSPLWVTVGVGVGVGLMFIGLLIGAVRCRWSMGRAGAWLAAIGLLGVGFWLLVVLHDYFVAARVGMAGCTGIFFIAAASIHQVRMCVATRSRRLARHWPIVLAIFLAAAQASLLVRQMQIANPPEFIHLAGAP